LRPKELYPVTEPVAKPNSPYANLDSTAFWRTAVADRHPFDIERLYRPKYKLKRSDSIATAGSCFAQEIGWRLRRAGIEVVDTEAVPPSAWTPDLSQYGFGMFSARYGNIYTPRELLQCWLEAIGEFEPAEPVWERDGRYYDALRPGVEPNGLATPEAVLESRRRHLRRLVKGYSGASVFLFTFGLTETWEHAASGTVYQTAPGTIAGDFDPAVFRLNNLTFNDCFDDFMSFRESLKSINPNVRFIVTVSPGQNIVTATDNHVLCASTYAKAVLRAVAGQLAADCDDIDYFPSYDLCALSTTRGFFYKPNARGAHNAGVDFVMKTFFDAHGIGFEPDSGSSSGDAREGNQIVCEEVLLEAFS
tara:strand:- start:11886 stop:12971 length:1086 start_codon:yes stop_codon:yes gene_type:complete